MPAACATRHTWALSGRPIQPASAACNARGARHAYDYDHDPGRWRRRARAPQSRFIKRCHDRRARGGPLAASRQYYIAIANTSGRAVTVIVITAHVRHGRAHPGRHARRQDRRPRPRRQLPGRLGRAPSAGLVREGGAPCTRTRPRIAAQVHTYMQISGSRCLHYHSKNA